MTKDASKAMEDDASYHSRSLESSSSSLALKAAPLTIDQVSALSKASCQCFMDEGLNSSARLIAWGMYQACEKVLGR